MTRRGINTNLSYRYDGKTYTFSIRAQSIAYGSAMIAEESQARTRRAYYPHEVSSVPFLVVPIIVGYKERVRFSNYLNDYVSRIEDPSISVNAFPTIRVSCPTRNFLRWGVPISGIEWGNHVGSMLWTPQVVFETHVDQSLGDTPGTNRSGSRFVLDKASLDASPQIKYFYPAGVQLSGNQVPDAESFDKVVSIQDIQSIINGGTKGGSDPGDSPVTPPFLPGQGSVPGPVGF